VAVIEQEDGRGVSLGSEGDSLGMSSYLLRQNAGLGEDHYTNGGRGAKPAWFPEEAVNDIQGGLALRRHTGVSHPKLWPSKS
jgi:hypothetical protein